jgi:chitinase
LANKIVVGIPFYGKKYGSVKNTSTTYPGLYQTYGRCTTVTYQEILKSYNSSTGYTRYSYGQAGVPYLFNGSTFISYDDPASIAAKTGYIKNNNLGGTMVWELSQDNNSELINAVYDGLTE